MASKRLGDTLRELRNVKGFTQQQVAEMLALKNKSTLGSWEVGKSEPDAYTFLRLCKIYEVKDIYSAFGEVSPVPLTSDPNTTAENYSLLSHEFQNIVDTLISQLIEIQDKQKK